MRTEYDFTVDEIFEMYGYKPPKPWGGKRIPKYDPKKDCFGYLPARYEKEKPKCTALNKLYCRYEECHFYKPYHLKRPKVEE